MKSIWPRSRYALKNMGAEGTVDTRENGDNAVICSWRQGCCCRVFWCRRLPQGWRFAYSCIKPAGCCSASRRPLHPPGPGQAIQFIIYLFTYLLYLYLRL